MNHINPLLLVGRGDVLSVRVSVSSLWALGACGAATVSLSLVFSWQAYVGWPARTGLNMTILALGTCMFIAATAQTQWKSPRILAPLPGVGKHSYEVFLTHMFVVFAFFDLFVYLGKPLRLAPILFTVVMAGFLGLLIATTYSEPVNRFLRSRYGNRMLSKYAQSEKESSR
jgi:peptidoglycan/LPS O-acetylase OafA/YrhL